MRLWTTHQASVANYVHALVRDRPAAQDVLQETALLAFRKFPEYDAERPFVAWTLGIARFKVMGLCRDAARMGRPWPRPCASSKPCPKAN